MQSQLHKFHKKVLRALERNFMIFFEIVLRITIVLNFINSPYLKRYLMLSLFTLLELLGKLSHDHFVTEFVFIVRSFLAVRIVVVFNYY